MNDTVWLVQAADEHATRVAGVCATEAAVERVLAELHEDADHAPDLERYDDGSSLCRGKTCGVSVVRGEITS